MNAAVEPIDGGKATLAELRRAGIDALARASSPVGMARFLQQFDDRLPLLLSFSATTIAQCARRHCGKDSAALTVSSAPIALIIRK